MKHDINQKFRLMLLVLMVLQNSSVVLVGRYTRANVKKEDLFVVNHLIIVTEFMKCILSIILEFLTSPHSLSSSIQTHILSNPLDFLKILIPALLYLVQNTLLYVALSNLSAPLFQVTYQTKLLTTALVSVLLLNRRYSLQQWICLTTLGMGVAIVVLAERSKTATTTTTTDTSHQSLALGLLSVTIACFSSAFAGVYFEKVVKTTSGAQQKPPPSLWMRNVQLAFFSIMIALGRNVTAIETKPFLHGFSFWVWVVVALQAGGGLLVAAVIKYADNVLKGLATGVAVVVSTGMSVLLFGTDVSWRFCVGSAVILASVYLFSNPMGGKKEKVLPR